MARVERARMGDREWCRICGHSFGGRDGRGLDVRVLKAEPFELLKEGLEG